MIKVLIVDDDAMQRIGLKTIVNWEQHGYELVGEAIDGKHAIELYEKLQPNIVITDIKMPNMDGVELIRALNHNESPPVVIVLSGYDDFLLVREAMKLGASDYLLKLDLSSNQILNSLEDARKRIGDVDKAVSVDKKILRNRVLKDLVSNFYIHEEYIQQRMIEADIEFVADQVFCFLIKVNDIFHFEETTEEEYNVLKFSTINITEEIARECLKAYCIEGKTGEFYVLGCIHDHLKEMDAEELILSTTERIREMLFEYLNISCTISIGWAENSISGIKEAQRQAIEALQYRFYAEDSSILMHNHCLLPKRDREELPYKTFAIRQNIINGLIMMDEKLVSDAVENLLKDVLQVRNRREMLIVALDLSGGVHEYCDRCGILVEQLLINCKRDIDSFLSLANVGEFKKWLETLKCDLLNYLASESRKGYQGVVSRAKKIIENRYNEELTLQSIADELLLNPGYLSTLMKKYSGMTFIEYLTHTRIQVAKSQLMKSNLKVYEIADKVGYQDQFYFSRMFKRVTGITPTEYRKTAGE